MLNKRVITLPPIQELLTEIGERHADDDNIEKQAPSEAVKKHKSVPFSAYEDVLILRAIRFYLGKVADMKIPWSFWQQYKKCTGSTRSESSLYHHWNGSMRKKYGLYLGMGRIDECIERAQASAANSEVYNNYISLEIKDSERLAMINPFNSYTSMPLQEQGSRPLIRSVSQK